MLGTQNWWLNGEFYTRWFGEIPIFPKEPIYQWIDLRESLNRKPEIFPFRSWGFGVHVPLNQPIETNMLNSMIDVL